LVARYAIGIGVQPNAVILYYTPFEYPSFINTMARIYTRAILVYVVLSCKVTKGRRSKNGTQQENDPKAFVSTVPDLQKVLAVLCFYCTATYIYNKF